MVRTRVFCLAVGAVFGVGPGMAATPEPSGSVASHTVEFQPPGSPPGTHPIKVVFDGVVYVKAGRGKDIVATAASKDEAFVWKVFELNRKGPLDRLLEVWLPEEREGKRALFTRDEGALFKKNQEHHKNVVRVEARVKLFYGNFVLFGLTYHLADRQHPVVLPLVERGGHYFLTDGLAEDPVFLFLMDNIVRKLGQPGSPKAQP